jgi:hypothetical protein
MRVRPRPPPSTALGRTASVEEAVERRFLLGRQVQEPDEVDNGEQEPCDADGDEGAARVEQEFAAKDGKDERDGEDDGELEAVNGEGIVA